MDTGILIPTLTVTVLALLGLVWRHERSVSRSVSTDVQQPRALASVSLPEEEESDLDIVVLKAVAIADLSDEDSDEDAGLDDNHEVDDTRNSQAAFKLSNVEVMYEDEAELEEVTSPFARILVSAAGDSDRGTQRARNEDSFLVLGERSLFAVADGVGGYRGGEIASALAIDTLHQAFKTGVFEGKVEHKQQIPRRGRELACAIQMGNQAIRAVAKLDPELEQMGTTLVAARFSPNKQRVYIGHVGDSRCYRLRGGALRQLTTDHTLGALGVRGTHAKELFQAMGIKPGITIDLIIDKPRNDDLYLLCSDGLSKMLTDEEIRSLLLREPQIEAAVHGLIQLANERGGRDNVTLILVKVLSRVPGELDSVT